MVFHVIPFPGGDYCWTMGEMAPRVGRRKCLASRPKPIDKILFYWGFSNTFTREIKLKTSK
jgi:hypothetical protein